MDSNTKEERCKSTASEAPAPLRVGYALFWTGLGYLLGSISSLIFNMLSMMLRILRRGWSMLAKED
jgi:hypothetical protein